MFVWNLDLKGFSTTSCYLQLATINEEVTAIEIMFFKGLSDIWRSKAPSKIQFFGWKCLLDRLPTKLNLLRRCIILINSTYPFCFNADETLFHLICYCDVAHLIWKCVCGWLGIELFGK